MSTAKTDVNTGTNTEKAARRTDFIREVINRDLKTGKYGGKVITRFPPEPNGFLHIGHAKSICLNFGLARDYNGVCHLRMDDTDPTKEDMTYVESIMRDIRWLGFNWQGKMFHASDYFGQLADYAVKLIQDGLAYVDSLSEQEIREYRGNLVEPGKNSPYRDRPVAENLDLFRRMKAGEFPDGAHVLRAKIDMANPNMKMRDPLLYRIRHVHHYHAGDWRIYPMYDFAHPISDALEGITYSICTLEFENNRELYDWVLDAAGFEKPRTQQYEFARLNLNYSVMSKRKFLALVNDKHVSGWDDPRMPTISGLRRRGVTPEALRRFCEDIGVAKANSTVDMAQLEACIRDDLNSKVPRVLCVLHPLKVVIENWPSPDHVEMLDSPYYPHDVPKEGTRLIPMTKEIFIERDDFNENPPKGYYRLSPGGQVRLRHGYVITCNEVIKDAHGQVVELRCAYDPATKSSGSADTNDTKPDAETKNAETKNKDTKNKVKGTIHWVSATQNLIVETRLYDRLFNVEAPDEHTPVNPNSLRILPETYAEISLKDAQPGSRFQFERQGYFYLEPESATPATFVFNRIVTLKDSWARQTAEPSDKATPPPTRPDPEKEKKKAESSKPESRKINIQAQSGPPQPTALTPAQEVKFKQYRGQYHLGEDEARLLAADDALCGFFEAALNVHANAQGIANWMLNELLRELKSSDIGSLPFQGGALGTLIALIDDQTISGKIAKDVFADMMQSGENPKAIVEKKGLTQISDPSVLTPIIDQLIAANPDNVALYRAGKNNVFGFFVGQVLKETGGKANPALVNELLQKKLSQSEK